ncbi:hypothetical protein BKA56DRAFT_505923 [Ilyonectria sp. MPI-CAGE-AT-0026]|nr:hypothetical protein BKA56DRAFT_505923 [Ilyonectria sp. MPI-CAGE-AT-0026]
MSCISSFPKFPSLPPEIRRQVWKLALLGANMSVISIKADPATCEPVQYSSVSSVALACREASVEWAMISCRFSEHFPVNVCLQRTICLIQGIPRSSATPAREPCLEVDMAPRIRHVAFLLPSNVNLKEIFAAFSTFHHLQTIIAVTPPRSINGVRHLDRHEISQIARGLAELADEPPTGSQNGKSGHVGLLLRGDPPSQAVRAFYSRSDAPQIKLLTRRSSQPSLHDPMLRSSSLTFSLIHYA